LISLIRGRGERALMSKKTQQANLKWKGTKKEDSDGVEGVLGTKRVKLPKEFGKA